MRRHYKPDPRPEPVADLLTALAIGLALAMLGMAYFDILWP